MSSQPLAVLWYFFVYLKFLFGLACFTDRPTEVKLGIYVNSFYSISEQTMVRYEQRVCNWWQTAVISQARTHVICQRNDIPEANGKVSIHM